MTSYPRRKLRFIRMFRPKRFWPMLFCSSAIVVFLCAFVILFSSHAFYKVLSPEEIQFASQFYEPHPLSSNSDYKLILFWTNNFINDSSIRTDLVDSKCPITNCVISFDRRFVKDASAVVFGAENFNVHDVPIERSVDQVYVWYNLQAPGVYNLNRKRSLKSLTEENGAASNKFFNWTASYSSASDILVAPKVLTTKSDSSLPFAGPSTSPSKKKLVAWNPEECKTDSGREVVHERLKDLPVDVFGHCGGHVCPEEGCWEYLSLRYIFYLSFENNLCVDYISDQVWEPLKAGLVPVVYGAANYSVALPPNSYIDARQFNADNLTSFLKRLSSDPRRLEQFHEWRSSYSIEDPDLSCALCSKLQEIQRFSFWGPTVDHVQSNTTVSLLRWWLDTNKCWTDYPKKTSVNKVFSGFGSVINLLKTMKIL